MATKKPKRESVDTDDYEDESPMTPEEARRELGWDLLPFNGAVPEVDE